MKTCVRARIFGRVQGVGFRPTVYRYAIQFGLSGYVCNTVEGVTLEVEGDSLLVGAFFNRLMQQPPRQAVIAQIQSETTAPKGYSEFRVMESAAEGNSSATISPDLATCDECLEELFEPANRRHGYPFINCTNCGPRFTIVRGLPYDREKTSMAEFSMCDPCAEEYHLPDDRRFHAQPNACEQCGPSLEFVILSGAKNLSRSGMTGALPSGPDDNLTALDKAVRRLTTGQIVAIKGLGGYHLACDPFHESAVARLRERKHRPHKALAVMFRDIPTARKYCEVSESEEAELLSPARPIVILKQRSNGGLKHGSTGKDSNLNPNTPSLHHSLSPDSPTLGAFLPYTPLHHLLLEKFEALVMTSGNRTDEPIVSDESELPMLLETIADAALAHNRPIVHKCDDSVVRIIRGQRQFFRRARGFVPNPIRLAAESPQILAVGGELKTTFCLVRDGNAFLSQHLGDLKDYKTYEFFGNEIAAWQQLMRVQPEIIAHDLHPAYLSTRFAEKHSRARRVGVQHHHAHIASVMAEHDLHEPVIGLALDGTGYGTDGTIWGGEILLADRVQFERAAHFKPYRLPGGDKAVEQPWRMAASVLMAEGLWDRFASAPGTASLVGKDISGIQHLVQTGFHSPLTSSAGRLFDAVSALLGLCSESSYEGQAAIRLEAIAQADTNDAYPVEIANGPWPWILNFGPMFQALLEDLLRGTPAAQISARFHNTLAAALVEACSRLREECGRNVVALSGGVFQNELLLRRTVQSLAARQFTVFTNTSVPPNDGGLALGQAAVALARKAPELGANALRTTAGELEPKQRVFPAENFPCA